MPTNLGSKTASFLVAATLTCVAHAAEYCVSPSGNDDSPGTQEQPWRTLAKANATLKPGDSATFLDGTYQGRIEPANSGCDGAPITYRAGNLLGAVITKGDRCVFLNKREHIVIDGFHMLPENSCWMWLTSVNHCTIRRCRMENATKGYYAVYCQDCHYNRYEDLECFRHNNLGKQGLLFSDLWVNRASTHNVFLRVHVMGAGHTPFTTWFDSSHTVLRRCIFDCRWGRNLTFFSTPRMLVEECVITNGFDGSGSADGQGKLFVIDSIFRRNVIYRNYTAPLAARAYKHRRSPAPFSMLRSRFYNNTWYRNHACAVEMRDLGAKPEQHRISGNIFQNSIFAFNDPGGDGVSLLLWTNIGIDNLFRFNVLFGDRPGCTTVRYKSLPRTRGRWDEVPMTAGEANEKMPAQFVGNMDVDPLFADAEKDDYRLQERSPCIDAGRPLTATRESGTGRRLLVDDARWFYDGFGIPGEEGDLVFIGKKKAQARVTKADIQSNVITLDRDISWQKGDSVSLPYLGRSPDLGAFESGVEEESWRSEPGIPDGLRVPTMKKAVKPVVVIDLEPEDLEEWHYYVSYPHHSKKNDVCADDATAASGKRSLRVFAREDGGPMQCHVSPRWWDIDRFPIVKFAYRIPNGVPVGLWLHAFESSRVGVGIVCLGGSPARHTGRHKAWGATSFATITSGMSWLWTHA